MTDSHDHTHSDSRFHLRLEELLQHISQGEAELTPEEAEAMQKPQHPDVFLIGCIDSRFQPDRVLSYGPGVALEYRPIAAVIPPPSKAETGLQQRMAFRRLQHVKNFLIVCHSDCGGARAAINLPDPDVKTGGDDAIVAKAAHFSGLDIPKLAQDFLAAANGDAKLAGNRLAKEIGVRSFENLLKYKGDGYPTVADEIKAGAAKAMLVYYDLEKHRFEAYDPVSGSWTPMVPPPKIGKKPDMQKLS